MARDTKERILAWRWLLVAPAMLLLWVVAQVGKINVSLVIADPHFLKDLNAAGNDSALGGLMSAFFLGYGISIFIWGFAVDRIGPRLCAITATLAWAGILFWSASVGNMKEYLFLRFLLGFAEGNLWPVCNTLTNRWFPAHEQSRAQAFWVSGATVGSTIGVPVVTSLILANGWRGAMVSLALISLIPIAIFAFVRNWPAEQKWISQKEVNDIESDRKATVSRMSFGESLKSLTFWLIMVCQAVSGITLYTMIQWIPTYVSVFRHVSFKSMGEWITLGYGLATILTLVLGYIADRTGRPALTGAWIFVTFVATILPACLMLSPTVSGVALSALICVPTATAALNGALIHKLVSPEAVARGTGVYVGVANLISAAGPTLFGYLTSALHGEFWGGFLFLGLLNALAAGCYFYFHKISRPTRQTVPLTAGAPELG